MLNKLISSILLLLVLSNLIGQEQFKFELVLIDAIGNSDTIVLGYDTKATKLIDTIFGEANINSIAWDSTFEVRITNAATTRTPYDTIFSPSIQTKKQIVNYECPETIRNSSGPIFIDIMAEHWPVSIIWDSSLFGDFCNLESSLGFTEIADVGYGLSRFDSISTEGFYGSSRPYSIYLTPQGDTISPVLCVQFSDSANVQSTDFVEIENFTIYPNPATNFLIIKIPQDKLHCRILYDLFNSKGSLVKSSELDSDRKIDINDIDKGLYFLRLHLPSNGICTKAFIKLK